MENYKLTPVIFIKPLLRHLLLSLFGFFLGFFAVFGVFGTFKSHPVKKNVKPFKQIVNPGGDLKKRYVDGTQVKIASPTSTQGQSILAFSGKNSFRGKVSHYSVSGCLGCNKDLRMANGEILDDNKYTIAVPPGWLAMNTKVLVTNLDNGKSVEARVTDTGGFWDCCRRIADLTPAVAFVLGTVTDRSEVEVRAIE